MNYGLTTMPDFLDWLWFDSIVTYLFLSVLTILSAALFASGIRRATVYRTAIGSFIVTILFFLLILILELTLRPLVFI
jgi:hypothetical protein